MAWFSGGLSNITDQISNFTKEVLVEGTEEVADHLTELQIAKSRILQLETSAEEYKHEYERLKRDQNEAEERAEAAELQIANISKEYRKLFHEKQNELIDVTEKYDQLLEQQQSMASSLTNSANVTQGQIGYSTIAASHSNVVNFEDTMACQGEINRLSLELSKMQAERDRLRKAIDEEQRKNKSIIDDADVESLNCIIKDLKLQLGREIDDHHREMVSQQQVYNQRISALVQKHKEESKKLRETREEDAETIKLLKKAIEDSVQGNKSLKVDQTVIEVDEADNERSLNDSIQEVSKRLTRLQESLKLMKEDGGGEVVNHLQQLQESIQQVQHHGVTKVNNIQYDRNIQEEIKSHDINTSSTADTEVQQVAESHQLSASREFEAYRADKDALEKSMMESEEERRQLAAKVTKLTHDNNTLTAEIETLREEDKAHKEHMEDTTSIHNEKIKELEYEIEKLKEEAKSVNEHHQEINTNVQAQQLTVIEDLKLKNQENNEQIIMKERQIENARITNTNLSRTIEDLELRKGELENKVQSLENELRELTSSTQMSKEILSDWESEKEGLETALMESRRENKQIKEVNGGLISENKSLVSRCSELEVTCNQVNVVNDKNKHLQIKVDDLQEELSKLNNNLKNHEQEKYVLSVKNESTSSEVNQLTYELQDLRKTLANVTDVRNKLETKISEDKSIVESLESQASTLRNEVLALSDSLQCKENSNRELEKKIESLNTENANLQINVQALTQVTEGSQNSQQEIQQQKTSIKSLEDEVGQLLHSNQALAVKLKDSDNFIQELQLKLHSAQLELSNQNSKLLEMKDSNERLIVEKEMDISSIKEERNKLLEERERLQQEVNRLQKVSLTYQHSQQDLTTDEIVKLRKQLQESQVERTQFLETIMERQREVSSLQSEVHKLTNIVGVDKDTINTLKADLFNHEKEIALKKTAILQLENAIKKYKNDADTMRIECEEMNNRLLNNESRHKMELERLRKHLVEVEESYTQEALKAKSKENVLYQQLSEAQAQVMNSTSMAQNNSRHALMQIDSLQEQLHAIATQRDNALLQLSATQEQLQQRELSLENLQEVLEQFQRDRTTLNLAEIQVLEQRLKKMQRENEQLRRQATEAQEKLEESTSVAGKIPQLESQMKTKDSIIRNLTNEVKRKESLMQEAKKHLKNIQNSNQIRVDKILVKNMLVSYLTISSNKKMDALKVLANILDFTEDEKGKVGLNTKNRSWMTSLLGFGSETPEQSWQMPTDPNESFTELFIKFLETESSSAGNIHERPPQTPKLDSPVASISYKPSFADSNSQMAHEQSQANTSFSFNKFDKSLSQNVNQNFNPTEPLNDQDTTSNSPLVSSTPAKSSKFGGIDTSILPFTQTAASGIPQLLPYKNDN